MEKSSYDRESRLKCFMTTEEQKVYYNEVLERVIKNPRFYLDNIDYLHVFRVSFIDYRAKKRRVYK